MNTPSFPKQIRLCILDQLTEWWIPPPFPNQSLLCILNQLTEWWISPLSPIKVFFVFWTSWQNDENLLFPQAKSSLYFGPADRMMKTSSFPKQSRLYILDQLTECRTPLFPQTKLSLYFEPAAGMMNTPSFLSKVVFVSFGPAGRMMNTPSFP